MNLNSIVFQQPNRNNPHTGITGYYSNVHFRIEKNGYTGQGWSDDKLMDGKWVSELRQAFASEAERLFTANGWSINHPGRHGVSATAVKGKSNLYLHPQDFSGVCENGEIETVSGFLTGANKFLLRTVDVYEEIYDMSDDELIAKLNSEHEAIRSEILTAYVTKRRNLFVSGTGPVGSIGQRHGVKRLALGYRSDFNGVDQRTVGICQSYAYIIFEELLNSGAIVSASIKNGTGYRTVPHNENKKLAG